MSSYLVIHSLLATVRQLAFILLPGHPLKDLKEGVTGSYL